MLIQLPYRENPGSFTNKFISLTQFSPQFGTFYSESDESSLEDLEGTEETETWRFKVLADQKLMGISKENTALYAKTLRRLTD